MCVKEIVKSYLKSKKFDGLCNEDIECGCGIDDLMPCGDVHELNCVPAYQWTAKQWNNRTDTADLLDEGQVAYCDEKPF